MADWKIKAGDTGPIFEDVLTLENGEVPDFTDATLALVMRSPTAAGPVTLTGAATFTSVSTGAVQFVPTLADTTDRAGQYIALWRVTLADDSTMSFPTEGYLSVSIEENLTVSAQQLVSLPEAKEYLGINSGDRHHDARLARFIHAARPTVENICGPIIPAEYVEWHTGGGPTLQVRRRPSSAYGTTPVLELTAVDEYLGSQLHELDIIDDPSTGSTYSCMIDSLGTITRRVGGGGIGCFSRDVRITYTAGQSVIPANVAEGTLEILRANWTQTRATGTGRMTVADDQDSGVPLHFFVPKRAAEMLAPNRRAPSIA